MADRLMKAEIERRRAELEERRRHAPPTCFDCGQEKVRCQCRFSEKAVPHFDDRVRKFNGTKQFWWRGCWRPYDP